LGRVSGRDVFGTYGARVKRRKILAMKATRPPQPYGVDALGTDLTAKWMLAHGVAMTQENYDTINYMGAPPVCPECGTNMHSHQLQGWRLLCRKCSEDVSGFA
jgi:hypothetical protein